MTAERERVPDLVLEQYALGELPPLERAKLDEALEADPELRSRLEEIELSNREILEEYPPAQIAAAIKGKMLSQAGAERQSSFRGRIGPRAFRPAAALPIAAALLVVAGLALARTGLFPSNDELTRAKGGAPRISVYRQGASGPESLGNGAKAAAGDLLQLRYSAGNDRYGAIFSVDGRGTITYHLPADSVPSGPAPAIEARGSILPSSYELDDAPAFERFFLVSSREGFDLSVVAKAAGELAGEGRLAESEALDLPRGIEVSSIILHKEEGKK